MKEGDISLRMGGKNIKTNFDIDVSFKDSACAAIFNPTELEV